jgi:hypothetical protein
LKTARARQEGITRQRASAATSRRADRHRTSAWHPEEWRRQRRGCRRWEHPEESVPVLAPSYNLVWIEGHPWFFRKDSSHVLGGERSDWFQAPWVVYSTLIALSALGLLIFNEFRIEDPIVDLSILADRRFTLPVTLVIFLTFTL